MRKSTRRVRSLPCLLLTLIVSAGGARTEAETGLEFSRADDIRQVRVAPDSRRHASTHVLVRFKGRPAALPGSGSPRMLGASGLLQRIPNPRGQHVHEVLEKYRRDPNVLYAEPDYVVETVQTPDDPAWLAGEQDNLALISAPAAWSLQDEQRDVVVAVMDTGIDLAHPDLRDSLWSHPANPGVHGYTCLQGVCVPGGADDHGHGTHVAGIVGARGNNGLGIAGVNWRLQLMPIKFLAANGTGLVSDAIAGLELLRTLKASGVNIRVVNHSWGGAGYSQALKDALSALDSGPQSTVHVCAAGNSGSNADFSPAYPAAFDNRNILSVLATDSQDGAASFSNFGVTSVDIAAPGVTTLSTAAAGQCTYCDSSGYRRLSGTSMAAPHVAGVAAALIARYPALSAQQIRDLMLHPDSYDPLQDKKASMTATGGRLNYLKALSNSSYLASPALNTFPTLVPGPDITVSAGETIDVSGAAQVEDPDGDSLRILSGRGAPTARPAWLLGAQAEQVFPEAMPYPAPRLARPYAMPYFTSVADGRGGSATASNWVTVSASTSPGNPPLGELTLPSHAQVGEPVTIEFPAQDPEGGPVVWERWIASGSTAAGACCFTGQASTATFSEPGQYRVSVQAMDRELLVSPTYTALITVGDGDTRPPPEARAVLSTITGRVPFAVDIDMRGSVDPDGTIAQYVMDCGTGGYHSGTSGVARCTFTQPGPHWLLLQVQDNDGQLGVMSAYVVATPALGAAADTQAPIVSWTTPAQAAILRGEHVLSVSATDPSPGSGIASVSYYLDGVGPGKLLATSAKAPYSISWDTWGVTAGAHRLFAVAEDVAGNRSLAAARDITVEAPRPPKMSLSANKSSVARGGNVTFTATLANQPTYGVQSVEFIISSTRVVCTDTTAPYTCRWTAPASTGQRGFVARARDRRGLWRDSNLLTIRIF